MPSAFNPLNYKLISRAPARMYKGSSWAEHTPFALFLIEILRPQMIVELGTQRGVSYAAFCQGVEELKLPSRCFAVDTWRGDAHATHYKETVFTEWNAYHHRYESFSKLLRMTFDEALDSFQSGSIDLLHIDGLHTYEAVRHDYESWLPKMSDRGVILFHDTMETERNFGVYKLWVEIAPRCPSFNFEHGHGLGVLAVGANQPPAFLDFLEVANERPEAIRGLFAALGRRVFLETERQWLREQPKIARTVAVLKKKTLAG
jgi:O-antigen biosynthesis protein